MVNTFHDIYVFFTLNTDYLPKALNGWFSHRISMSLLCGGN